MKELNPNRIKWSGRTTAYPHKRNPKILLSDDTPKGVRKQFVLDVQWTTTPIEVEEQVQELWQHFELGNDSYILKLTIEGLQEHENTDAIVQYLRENGVGEDDQVWIHWWW